VATGVSAAALLPVAGFLQDALGAPVPGQLARAGLFPPAAGADGGGAG
jgi:hypothetical protein